MAETGNTALASLAGCRRSVGFSVSELMMALAVAALLAAAAAPGMAVLIARGHTDAAADQMLRAVQFTRHTAVSRRATATLCPGGGDSCGPRDSWHEGAMVFLDGNANGRREPAEEIVRRLPPLPDGHRVRWRSFRNRLSLSMLPSGLTDSQSGNLLVCPDDGDPRRARQLVINAQGRIRWSRDGDGDGIVEDARGDPVSCVPAP